MTRRTIVTRNAIINGAFSLIKKNAKYLLSEEFLKDGSTDENTLIRTTYRRFFRLRQFISNRKMVRDTYTDYIRYKFKLENYPLKRSLIFNVANDVSLRDELWNSLIFVTKATCYLPENKDQKWNLARDNTMCRQILKNILTMEFGKQSLIINNRNRKSNPYKDYRLTFDHIRYPHKTPNFKVIEEFDRCILYLNEMLHTRL